MISVKRGRNTGGVPENLVEILNVAVSHLLGNFVYLHFRVSQKLNGLFHSHPCKIIGKALACFALKQLAEIGGAQVAQLGKVVQGYTLGIVGI